MNKRRRIHFFCAAILIVTLSGCQSVLPVRSVPVEEQAALYKAPTFIPTATILVTPTPDYESTKAASCTSMLQFVAPDLTYPDGTEVTPGQAIDKQWKVKNSGTCNWDATYSIKLIGGEDMGAAATQALVPARNGTETVLSIQFVAPDEPGRHYSQWKAYDSNGQSFGDVLFVDIWVTKE